MALDRYSDVILTRDIEGHRLRAGDVGSAVERQRVAVKPRPLDLRGLAPSSAGVID
jgi:hypothetical protein